MKGIWSAAAVLALVGTAATACLAADKKEEKVTGPLSFKMKNIDGKEVDLSQYKGKVVLFVNVYCLVRKRVANDSPVRVSSVVQLVPSLEPSTCQSLGSRPGESLALVRS